MSQTSAASKPIGPAKSPSGSNQTAPTVSAAQQFFSSGDSRRSGQPGAVNQRHTQSTAARNNQQAKPKHKGTKRFKPLPDDDADAEMFSMQNPHGRRGQQSITHLMQFSLPPRPTHGINPRHHHSLVNRRKAWGLGSGYHAMDKARYIHANYRFIVSPKGDYHAHAQDADTHLEWTDVLQIIASSKTQASSCPICLGDPTAPRMAKCGHIFCLPCLIRYMHSEDTAAVSSGTEKRARFKKCPICWDSIYITDTRPVRWYAGNENDPPQESGDVVLRLVRRRAESTLAMPRESPEPLTKNDAVPWYFAAEVMDYARIMKGSQEYMIEQYDQAIASIDVLEKQDELMFGEDAEWTSKARRMLAEAKEKVRGIGNAPEDAGKPQTMTTFIDERHSTQATRVTPLQDQSSHDDHQIPRTLNEMRQKQMEKPQPAEYLFYHALQHYYLSPLDIRILKAAFGSYAAFPSSILPRVERVSSGHVVDDDLRKRMKYLSHLPSGCEVGFLECDWTDTVPAAVLAEFEAQIKKRRVRNGEKEAKDEKERIRIQKDADKEYAALRRPRRPSVTQASFSADQLPTLSESMTDGSAPIATSPPWPRRSIPGYAPLASPSTSPSAQRTVWGTAAIPPSSPEVLPLDADVSHEEDGWLQDWEKDLLTEVDLSTQVEGINIGTPKSGGKRGKKSKKITLMSTTTRRGA